MKIIFFGTPDYVIPILSSLQREFNRGQDDKQLIGVVTQSPKPAGREKKLEYSAVDEFAHKHKIDIYFDPTDLPEADLGICAAYGQIVPEHTIKHFPLGILNVHPSLLPDWRGASPTQAAIVTGDKETGVSIIKMDNGMDHGPLVSSFRSEIRDDDTNETLRIRLFEETVPFLLELIPSYIAGKIHLKEQDHSFATFTTTLKKDDGYIPGYMIKAALEGIAPTKPFSVAFMKGYEVMPDANFIGRYFRATNPWPGIWTKVVIDGEEKRLKIVDLWVENNMLIIQSVQLEGKNPVSWSQFVTGHPGFAFENGQ